MSHGDTRSTTMRGTLALLLVLLLPALAYGQGVVHVEGPSRWSSQPVRNAALADRIHDAAATYRSYAPVPRVAFFDAAYPKDSTEYVAMNGYALLVVTALAQDSAELPLARLYLGSVNGELDLTSLFTIRSTVAARDSVERFTFGPFRADALYLYPVASRSVDLLADFAAHRRGFRLGQLGRSLPNYLERISRQQRATALPSRETIAVMLRREYPDLAQFLAAGP